MAQATGVLEFGISLQEVLATRNLALVLQIVDGPEAAVALYGEWWAERRFDVMVVTDSSSRTRASTRSAGCVPRPSSSVQVRAMWTSRR